MTRSATEGYPSSDATLEINRQLSEQESDDDEWCELSIEEEDDDDDDDDHLDDHLDDDTFRESEEEPLHRRTNRGSTTNETLRMRNNNNNNRREKRPPRNVEEQILNWKFVLLVLMIIMVGSTFNIGLSGMYDPSTQTGEMDNQRGTTNDEWNSRYHHPIGSSPHHYGGPDDGEWDEDSLELSQFQTLKKSPASGMSDFEHGEWSGVAITPEQKATVKKGGIWTWTPPPTPSPTKEPEPEEESVDLNTVVLPFEVPVLEGYKDVWDPVGEGDNAVFWHIPKAGGSSVKNILGSCHRMRMAAETGIRKGHDQDTEIAIVFPGGATGHDSSPFVNVDTTTIAGLERAKSMGLAESGLADIIVTPYFHEANDIFPPSNRGRLFTMFRNPIDRAVSMFYYIRVADWEATYNPELKNMSIEEFAKSTMVEDNWMVRHLTNALRGQLTDDHLNVAMDVVRRKFLVGLLSQTEASLERFEKFFGWKYRVNPPNQETCRGTIMAKGANSNEVNKQVLETRSEAYRLLAYRNRLDMKLYRYIEDLFVQQGNFVAHHPDGFRLVDTSCSKCVPPTFPVCPEGRSC